MSSEYLCLICQKGSLIFRDYCSRIIRYEDGTHEWLRIPRHQCSNDKCRRIHRMLPDILTPFKHYNEFNIEEHMKSIGYRLLGLSEELLETGISLLSHM